MDIIDIMLAKAMTPQGQTEAYVAKANAAAAKAAKAQEDAEAAVAIVTSAASDIADAQSAAATLLETAEAALETAQAAQGELPTAYGTTGQNTDGYMTQKAVTEALAAKASTSDLAAKADKTYVDQQIAAIPSGGGSSGGSINMDPADANHLVKVDSNGNLVASLATEDAVVEALLRSGAYEAVNAVGLDIDYANRAFTRV